MDDKILALIHDEVDRRVDERLAVAFRMIADTFNLRYEKIMSIVKKIPEVNSKMCRGFKKNGECCSFRSVSSGFCKRHIDQKKDTINLIQTQNVHTHSLPPLYLKGCPACDALKKEN